MSTRDDERLIADAHARWRRLDHGHQMALARCMANCVRGEFTRRHKQVVSVAAGLKRRADASGAELLYNEPCVVFLVRQKLAPSALARQPTQMLPRQLMCPAWVDGREQVVAVPTDVQAEQRLLAGRAQAATAVRTLAEDGSGARGSVAWTFVAGGRRFALSAIHVLSPEPRADGIGRRGGLDCHALSADGAQPVGSPVVRSTSFGGRLTKAPARSLDAQLAELLDGQRLRALFGTLRLSTHRPWVRDEAELDQLLSDGRPLEIHVPGNNRHRADPAQAPLSAVRSLAETDFLLDYDFADGRHRIVQRAIELQVRFGDVTLAGDSGCPVLLPNDNDFPSFVGMHVAGNPATSSSFVIPAWQLLDPAAFAEVEGDMPAGPWSLPARA